MKQHVVRMAALGCVIALTGCAKFERALVNGASGVTGAEALDTTKDQMDAINAPTATTDATAAGNKKAALLVLVAQSYNNCDDYKRLLLLGSRSSNFAFDMAATTFSTLGTVFTHVDVIHGFTAATAITTGTKTALDADIYENATAPLMVQAINQTYGTTMDKLLTTLEGWNASAAPPGSPTGAEYADIVKVNSECSLTEAMGELQALQGTGTSPVANPRIALNTDLANLATDAKRPAMMAPDVTALETAMTTAATPPIKTSATHVFAEDESNIVSWAAASTTTDAQVQTLDTAIKGILKPT